MTRKTMFGISAVLGAAMLALAPENPAGAAEPTPELKDQLQQLKATVDRLESIEKRLTENESRNALSIEKLRRDLNAANEAIRLLQSDVTALNNQVRSGAYTARRIDTPPSISMPVPGVLAGGSRVRFINDYVDDLSILVNGRSYHLVPGQQVVVPVSPGSFTYQVMELQRAVQTRTIADNETKDIRIHVRQ